MIRVNEKRRLRNRPIRGLVRAKVREAQAAISDSTANGVEAVAAAIKQLDKAVSKGVIHANNAARRKSRLMKRLNEAKAAS